MLKRILSHFLCGVAFVVGMGVAVAGTITATGMSQGDLVTFLTNTVTISNELKDDVDDLRAAQYAVLLALDSNGTIGADASTNGTDSNDGNDWVAFYGPSGTNSTNNIPAAGVAASDLSLSDL